MHSFESKVTVDSKVLEGVRITVRRLSQAQRAKRDLQIVGPQVRIAELNERMSDLAAEYTIGEMPLDARVEYEKFDREMGAIINAHVKPATIRAGFVKIEGVEYDGKPATAEALLENGPDELIDEVWTVIADHAALSPDQQKNLQSPSISAAVEGGDASTMTAATASDTVTSSSETAGSTTQTT